MQQTRIILTLALSLLLISGITYAILNHLASSSINPRDGDPGPPTPNGDPIPPQPSSPIHPLDGDPGPPDPH